MIKGDCTMTHKYLKHIPCQVSYKILDDNNTIEICGCYMQPNVDGVIWEYCDEKIEKITRPPDIFEISMD